MAFTFKFPWTKDKVNDTVYDPFGDVNARWYSLKDNEDYAKTFQEVPELNAIVVNKAKQLAKGIWRCKDLKSNEIIEDDRFLSLLRKPNPLMSGAEFLASLSIDWDVFGNAYNFFLTPLDKKPTPENVAALYNLDARYTFPQATGKIFKQTDINEIVSKYIFDVRGTNYEFSTDKICHISSSNINFLNGQYLLGESPLKSLTWALSNIKAAYEARNIYITRRGAFGIFSNNSTGDLGTQPIEKQDKDQLQKDLNKYGLTKNQWQFIITNANLKWNPITLPTKDLELYKEVKEDVIAIATVYNYPILLLNYMEGSTYANQNIATRQLYTDAIIPAAQQIAGEINRSINAYDFNKEYYLDYSHIEALQADKKTEAERNEISIRTLLEVNRAIKEGNLTLEAAINIITMILKVDENEAKNLLS